MFFNNLRKRTSHNFSRTFEWMRSFIEHIYSAASITTTFTPKLPTLAYSFHELVDEVSLNRCHSSRIAFINSEIIWHFGLRWFTLRPIKSHTCSIGFIWGTWQATEMWQLLPEFSYNASPVQSGVIVNYDGPVRQWMIIKMRYNVCVKHVVAVCNAIDVTF